MSRPVLDAVKAYLESVPYRFTETPTMISLNLTADNGTFTVNLTSNEEWGWLTCYVIGPTKVPVNARPTVAEYLHRVNYRVTVGDFEFNYDDGSYLFKTNCLAGQGLGPTSGGINSAIHLGLTSMDQWHPGVMAILYAGLSAGAALQRAIDATNTSGAAG